MDSDASESRMMTSKDNARHAIAGDKGALNELVSALQGDLYRIAFRMLCNREDAEDATQEILIRIVTHLSQFDFRSELKTWAYRIAVNYTLDVKKSAVERTRLSFEQFAEDITPGLSADALPESEALLLIEESKSNAHLACCSAWTGNTVSHTSSARLRNCRDRKRQRS